MDADGSVERVALGGTFDPIHDGHRALFERAFERGHVTVGLTTDELAKQIRDNPTTVTSYQNRFSPLYDVLRSYSRTTEHQCEIRPLAAPTDIAHAPIYDVLVVSPETARAGEAINEIRAERDCELLEIDVVPHVLAEDEKIISSTRIRAGEIDEHGNIL